MNRPPDVNEAEWSAARRAMQHIDGGKPIELVNLDDWYAYDRIWQRVRDWLLSFPRVGVLTAFDVTAEVRRRLES
jgi:hypothetical protein